MPQIFFSVKNDGPINLGNWEELLKQIGRKILLNSSANWHLQLSPHKMISFIASGFSMLLLFQIYCFFFFLSFTFYSLLYFFLIIDVTETTPGIFSCTKTKMLLMLNVSKEKIFFVCFWKKRPNLFYNVSDEVTLFSSSVIEVWPLPDHF